MEPVILRKIALNQAYDYKNAYVRDANKRCSQMKYIQSYRLHVYNIPGLEHKYIYSIWTTKNYIITNPQFG